MKFIKIASLLLTILICSSLLFGCGSSKEIYEQYCQAEQKTDSLNKYNATLNLSINADFGDGSGMNVESKTDQKTDLENAVFLQTIEYKYPDYDQSSSMVVYHENGYTYYDEIDQNSKYKVEIDDITAMKSVSSIAAFNFSENAFSKADITKNNSDTIITAEVNGEDIKDTALQFLSGIDSLLGVENEYDISNAKLSLQISDGYLTEVLIDFDASFDNSGAKASVVVHVDVNYVNVNGDFDILAPEGLDQYPDYDENAETTSSDDISEEEGEAVDAAFELFEDDHITKVKNYDELYKAACEKYGKDTIDSIISVITAFGSIK